MKKSLVIGIFILIGILIIAFFISANITGNVVKIGWWDKKQIYTVEEVDNLIKDLNMDGETVYYTKSEINNLLNALSKGESIVINNNDTYTKSQIDSLINSINKTTIQQNGIDAKEVLEILNQNTPTYDYLTIRGSGNHLFPNNCDEVCENTENWNIEEPMICIGAIGIFWGDIENRKDFHSHHYECDTSKSTYIQNAFSESEEIYAQCICVSY